MSMHWPPKLGFMVLAVVGAALAAGGLVAVTRGKRGPTEAGHD